MEKSAASLQSPTYGDLVTVLSIDGGGIRGIIPGTILSFLESELQVKRATSSDNIESRIGNSVNLALTIYNNILDNSNIQLDFRLKN